MFCNESETLESENEMSEEKKPRGAVEVVMPDEAIELRLDTIRAVARTCEKLAEALCASALTVNFSGNITAVAERGVKVTKRRPRNV